MSARPGVSISNMVSAGKLAQPAAQQRSDQFDLPSAPAQITERPKPGQVIKMRLDMLDDSPYQVRRSIPAARVDEIGQSMSEAGQIDPIEVRIKPNGRGEIIKGHTRKRSALSIGWQEIDALVVERSDAEASLAVMIDNIGKTPSDYEWAGAFRMRLDSGAARTQSQLATMAGFPQSAVSKCLAMLTLPAPVLQLLDENPALFSSTTAADIGALWKEFPAESEVILDGIKRFSDTLPQKGLRAWVMQKLNSPKSSVRQPNRRVISFNTGNPAYVTIVKDRTITLKIDDPSLDVEVERKALEDFMRERVETLSKK